MSDDVRVFEITVNSDELGELEELSWDLTPVVASNITSHLDENGLPRLGTVLTPGMILVGKIGKTNAYASERKPTDLEIHGLDFSELKERFGHLWMDASEYVPEGVYGEVVSAKLKANAQGKPTAIVELRLQQ